MMDRITRTSYLLIAILCFVAFMIACDGSSDSIGLNRPGFYTVNGGFVKDLNRDLGTVVVEVNRDDSVLAVATIGFGPDTLVFVDPHYKFNKGPALLYPSGAVELHLRDNGFFEATIGDTIPDTFSIESVMPDRREKLSFEWVQLEWTGSAGADGYIIAAAKMNEIYSSRGFGQYVASQATSDIFEPEAFTLDNDPANEIDTGWYYLYVYAYSGTTDSVLTSAYLPVPLPSQLPDNIDERNLDGHFGTVLVIASDSMHVLGN